MLKTGEQQVLQVVKLTDFGVYLAEEAGSDDKVLLPVKQVPEGTEEGSLINVFIYRDSEDRLIATTRTPMLTVGKVALLTVKDVGKIGAFLDWGLEKDLFLPFKEQTRRVGAGDKILAALYIDKSGRLCATMKLYSYLKVNSPYVIGDEVTGIIYEDHPKYGLFTAIENTFSGLIPRKDAQGKYSVGDVVKARVTAVREDGRVEISPKKKAYLQLGTDAELILEKINEYGGELPFDDHAAPELIAEEFGLSKAAFKRGVGHLLKEDMINISDGKILLRKDGKRIPLKRTKAEPKKAEAFVPEKQRSFKNAVKKEEKETRRKYSASEKPEAKKSEAKKPYAKKPKEEAPKRFISSNGKSYYKKDDGVKSTRRFLKPSEKISLKEFYEKEGM